mmetsp:Transcript_12001/g.35491  ORF Transcript_12001/g.35491 Transcript_12001/m.35491 type:complete len:229 (-) Transcript_12001:309-995(-)
MPPLAVPAISRPSTCSAPARSSTAVRLTPSLASTPPPPPSASCAIPQATTARLSPPRPPSEACRAAWWCRARRPGPRSITCGGTARAWCCANPLRAQGVRRQPQRRQRWAALHLCTHTTTRQCWRAKAPSGSSWRRSCHSWTRCWCPSQAAAWWAASRLPCTPSGRASVSLRSSQRGRDSAAASLSASVSSTQRRRTARSTRSPMPSALSASAPRRGRPPHSCSTRRC